MWHKSKKTSGQVCYLRPLNQHGIWPFESLCLLRMEEFFFLRAWCFFTNPCHTCQVQDHCKHTHTHTHKHTHTNVHRIVLAVFTSQKSCPWIQLCVSFWHVFLLWKHFDVLFCLNKRIQGCCVAINFLFFGGWNRRFGWCYTAIAKESVIVHLSLNRPVLRSQVPARVLTTLRELLWQFGHHCRPQSSGCQSAGRNSLAPC